MSNLAADNTFIIPVLEDFIVYSPLANISALLNRRGVSELRSQLKLSGSGKADPDSKTYKLANDIITGELLTIGNISGGLNPHFLGIIPTRSCNGACNYCDFAADKAPAEKMSYDLAVKAVDWYADLMKKNNRKTLEIHFFGGEPMMSRDIMEVVVHRARLVASEQNLTPYFEISTNGQYSSEDAAFLRRYINKIVLSLDGFREVHNRHRPLKNNQDSYENAIRTAEIISSSDADLCIRSCVSELNISGMEIFTDWLCRNLRLSAINFEILTATSLTSSKGLFPPDPVEFAVNFQKARETGGTHGVEVVYSSDITDLPVRSSCPVGKDTAIISPVGRISSCYLMPDRWIEAGLDLEFGVIDNSVQIDLEKVNRIRQMVEQKPRCRNCFCQWTCAGGCHVGITFPGCSPEYDNFCIQTRIISAFSLLSELAQNNKISELISSHEQLLKIAHASSDKITDYHE
jgi:uncharacterized protein